MKSRAGFTLIELVIFSAIFAITAIVFVNILIIITRIQVRQGAAAEVNQQSQFLLQNIQRYVEQSSLIEMTKDAATSTLRLRTNSSTDPTTIYLSGGRVYLKETVSGTPTPLTSNRVNVLSLTFTKRQNPGGRDSVSVAFTVEYNTTNLQQRFSQILNTSIARVSAATFDSDIRASSTNTYKIGTAAQEWQSINNTMFFGSTGNIDIGGVGAPASSGVKLQVTGGNVFVNRAGSGLVLKAPNGTTCILVSASNTGALVTSSVACP